MDFARHAGHPTVIHRTATSDVYSTCLFCDARLGVNDSIEGLPVGRRVAFDSAKGRAWVVCRACERWNLTPIEERWEVVEECERRFRATSLRASTGQIGLCRLADGAELVRIGEPLRPELAAWRYGDQFGRRRQRRWAAGTGTVLGGAALALGGLTAGASLLAVWSAAEAAHWLAYARRHRQVIFTVPDSDGRVFTIRGYHLAAVRLLAPRSHGDSWRLRLGDGPAARDLTGPDAIRAAGTLLARVNAGGAAAHTVQCAVDVLEAHGSADRCFAHAADHGAAEGTGSLKRLPAPLRLALEMAAHEDTERRILDGELALLEGAWRAAEEIAAISDDLLLPRSVTDFIDRAHGG